MLITRLQVMFGIVRGVLQGSCSQHTGSLLESQQMSLDHTQGRGRGRGGWGAGEGEGGGGL